MIFKLWTWMVTMKNVAYIKRRCRALMREAGYTTCPSSKDWICSQCDSRLDDVQIEVITHTPSGETIRVPKLSATMCPRCAWVSDGSTRLPVWKWLAKKNKSSTSKQFFLKNEQACLRIRLAEIEQELNSRPTLVFDDPRLKEVVKQMRAGEDD